MSKWYDRSLISPGQMVDLISGIELKSGLQFRNTLFEGFPSNLGEEDSKACYFDPFPKLVPCEDWHSLIGEIFSDYLVEGRDTCFLGTSILEKHTVSYEQRKEELANFLGLPLSYCQGYSFVLVKLYRTVPSSVKSLSRAEQEEVGSRYHDALEKYDDLYEKDVLGQRMKTPKNIETCLNFITHETGSHYVESVTIGDMAYQVFVYDKEKFKRICRSMDESGWTGVGALSFRYFTSSTYCSYVGKVNLLSRDEAFESLRLELQDKVYHVSESIFMMSIDENAQKKLCELTSLTCIGTKLKAFSCLEQSGEHVLKLGASKDDLIDAITIEGCMTRYGVKGTGPAYYNSSEAIDYARIYQSFCNDAPLSVVWTPFFSKSQMYIDLNDLFKQKVVNQRDVKHLVITADVIEVQDDLDLSFLESIVLGCRVFKCGNKEVVPTITLNSKAWGSKKLYCQKMIGNCIFKDSDDETHHQMVFGDWASCLLPEDTTISYEEFFAGKFPLDLFFKTEEDDYTNWCKTALQNGLDTLVMSAIVPLMPETAYIDELKETAYEAWACLNWILEYTETAVKQAEVEKYVVPEEISMLYAQCSLTLKTVYNPNNLETMPILTVPQLRYTAYEDAINRLLALSKSYGEKIDEVKRQFEIYNEKLQNAYVEQQRDQNIKAIAQFMIDQNKALAEKEKDLMKCHDEIISKKQDMIDKLTGDEKKLEAQYKTYTQKLSEAQQAMVDAVEKTIREERAKVAFDFTFGILQALITIGTATCNWWNLGDTAAKKTLACFDAFLKYAEAANTIIASSEHLADEVGTINKLNEVSNNKDKLLPPSDADWEIFMNDCIAQVKPIEAYAKGETAQYISVLQDICAISKALNAVIKEKTQYTYEIFTEEASKKVSENQSKRLEALSLEIQSPDWTPDADSLLDLGQFDAILQQKQNQSLLKLVDLLRLQNASMTFYYLSKPTIISQFDILSIEEALSTQALSAVKTLETYPYPPTNLLQPITIKIDHIATEDLLKESGVEVQIPMDQELFDTLCRVRVNSIDGRVLGVSTSTGRCHLNIESLGDPMYDRGLNRELLTYKTLLRQWHVVYDIEKDQTIIGTEPSKEWGTYFTKPTPFQRFRISIPKTSENKNVTFTNAYTSITLSFMVEACYSANYVKKSQLMNTNYTSAPSFLNPLEGHTITDGWDVVSFFPISKINKLWEERWQKEVDGAYKGDKMFVQSIRGVYEEKIVSFSVKYELEADLGAPWLEFMASDNASALVKIPIIKGNLKITTTSKTGEEEVENIPITKNPEQPSFIKTKCTLRKFEGKVDEQSVCIELGDHPFEAEEIEIDPVLNTKVSDIITTYFRNEKLQPWFLGTLKLATDIAYLKPRTFRFQTYTSSRTDYPDVLALYILTVTEKEPEHGMRRSWPDQSWMISRDWDAAVYFSADLLWRYEIIAEINRSGLAADLDLKNRMIKLKNKEEVFNQSIAIKHGWEASHNVKTVYEKAIVNFDFGTVELSLGLEEMKCHCNTAWDEKFPYQDRTPCAGAGDVLLDTAWDNVNFKCKFDNSSRADVNAETFDVTFEELQVQPNVEAKSPDNRVFFIKLPQVSSQVVDNAKAKLEKRLSSLKFNFKAMPMFAVSNLLFPESKIMTPSGVFFPYDLVIIGKCKETEE